MSGIKCVMCHAALPDVDKELEALKNRIKELEDEKAKNAKKPKEEKAGSIWD